MSDRDKDMLRTLLAVLKDANGDALGSAVLQVRLEPKFFPRPTSDEIETTIRRAETAGMVIGAVTETDDHVWAISNKGRLAEL